MVVLGIKTLETRSFPVPKGYTGRLYIQASRQIPGKVYEQYLRDDRFRLWVHKTIDALYPHNEVTYSTDPLTLKLSLKDLRFFFPLGGILGHVDLGKSWPAWELGEEWKKEGRWFTDWQREWVIGDLGSDRFAWELSNPVKFDKQIPAKGTISPMLWDATKYLNPEM